MNRGEECPWGEVVPHHTATEEEDRRHWNKHLEKLKKRMHYRNGREAKNGDKVIQLEGGEIRSFGVLHSATPGNDYCNGEIAVVQSAHEMACICDCLHVDDIAAILAEKGLDKRPAGK